MIYSNARKLIIAGSYNKNNMTSMLATFAKREMISKKEFTELLNLMDI